MKIVESQVIHTGFKYYSYTQRDGDLASEKRMIEGSGGDIERYHLNINRIAVPRNRGTFIDTPLRRVFVTGDI